MAIEDTPDDGMADWAEALLEQKSGEGDAPPGAVLSGDAPRPFSTGSNSDGSAHDINMVLDIPVQLSVELGRTKVPIKHILQLGQGSVVELDALAGEPMDVLCKERIVLRGEVTVLEDSLGLRVTEIMDPDRRV